jgi:hypothetical protein
MRKKAMAKWIKDQPKITEDQLHPRNKSAMKKGSDVGSALGENYNAHKLRLLDRFQLEALYQQACGYEVDHRGSTDQAVWCHRAVCKEKKGKKSKTGIKKSRGVELPAEYRYGLFSTPTENEKEVISWERTHIILAMEERFPPSSEHEVSHRCHVADCIKTDHLLWELHPDNVAREECRHKREITCSNCGHIFSECPHKPKCL